MKIRAFLVLVECDNCEGKKKVPGGQREYGELVPCSNCDGKGTMKGHVLYEDFARLFDGLVRR